MQRSAGVTAVGVAALILGVLGCLFALLMSLSAFMLQRVARDVSQPNLPINPGIIVAAEAALFLAVGGWSIASAIGLFRLKMWARVSVMILGGLLVGFGLISLLGAGLISTMTLPTPAGQAVQPAQVKALIGAVMGVVAALQIGIGAWWIVALSRRSAGDQFRGDIAVAPPA